MALPDAIRPLLPLRPSSPLRRATPQSDATPPEASPRSFPFRPSNQQHAICWDVFMTRIGIRMLLFLSCFAFAARPQNTPAHRPHRDYRSAIPASSIVHVQLLAMPPKAARAFDKGSALVVKHEYQASLAHLQKAIELAPKSFPPYHNLGLAQYSLG